jgi:nucleotide-binding universal stress UspA family protein
MLAIRKILVGTDFSPCSDAALRYGRDLARQFGAALHLMHVVAPAGPVDIVGMSGYVAAVPEIEAQAEKLDLERLEAMLTEEERKTLCVTTVLHYMEPPAQALVEYARSQGIDLMVVGTHGRRGLTHLILGSVAERIVRTAPCPVLIVHESPKSADVVDRATAMTAPA